ncbi:hypothetical protein ANO11243_083300 [Dothideomycetidae sp. 11243]|nr:hypothetical protein ANO11243_083300 [fungal sp. No.11243]
MAQSDAADGHEGLVDGDVHHYDSASEMPANIQKYWHQRHDLFSRYDEGVRLTDAAWFGVTPEAVAHRIAADIALAAPPDAKTIIDLFAGAGGNTIALALSGRWEQIFAIERDAATLECAKHNARLYGVENRIWFIHGDCFDVVRKRLKGVVKDAVLFGSPPWGGPGYRDEEVFDLLRMEPYGIEALAGELESLGRGYVLYLPRSSDLNQIAAWKDRLGGQEGKKLRVTHYCMRGASKALCVFYGDFQFEGT